jgi:molybdopterin synthase sulfur carrier subunit
MFAVNESYETMDYNLQDNDMIAIIPPVSGG